MRYWIDFLGFFVQIAIIWFIAMAIIYVVAGMLITGLSS